MESYCYSGGWDYVYIYVNGNLTKKISYYTEANAKTDTAYSIHNYLASEDWSVLYGKDGTGYWSNATDGYIDDFTIRNGVYSAKSVYKIDKESIADKLLSVGIKDYQDSMAKLKDADYVYLGMGDAYLAYDRIHRYIDACKYGNHEPNDEEIQQLYDELEAKITYMESHRYKKPTSTVQGYEQSGKNKVDEKYTHNMLTKPDQLYSVVEQDGATNDDGFNTRISTSNFVWLYTGINGDTPTAPYSVGYYRSTTQSRKAAAFYIANSVPMAFGGAGLGSDDNYWHVYKNGYDNAGASNNVNWYYENYQEKFKMDSKYDSNNLADTNNNQSWYNGSGYARFTGNNSTFTTHVVTSSGTDTYSAIAASIASLKGPKHGGANLKVQRMFADIMEHCSDWENKDEICEYLLKILDKQAFDHAGLIYGMGHAVYTLSDPRAVILKKFAKSLSEEKGMQKEFALYELVEREAGNLIMQKRQMFKPVCANVDFYSGFVYSMLGIPEELFTPIFAISRVSGWCSHRLEELVNAGKIIRPAYKYVGHHRPYYDINNRDCEQK